MKLIQVLASAAVFGGLSAGAMGVASTAAAQEGWNPPPAPPAGQDAVHPAAPAGWNPPPAAPPAGPNEGTPPAWAPPKPVDPSWANGQPQVWDEGWQHWGVWLNGVFVPTY